MYQNGLNKYCDLLKAFAALSQLFSESPSPYVEYRAMENIFCRSFKADHLAREDGAFDAKLGTVGIGLKTYIMRKKNVEKIAEFNRHSQYIRDASSSNIMVERIAYLRNERMKTAINLHGIEKSVYHCVLRRSTELIIKEYPYPLIDLSTVYDISKTDKKLTFKDKHAIYQYNFSKSVLFKEFSHHVGETIATVMVNVLDNPYEILLKLLSETHEKPLISVILPLYSTRYEFRQVAERSGLNQWNANGRVRDLGEIYIPIPSFIHAQYPDFFPKREKIFSLITPDGKLFQAKICQAGGKALMTNPNNALSNWLLRHVFDLKPGQLLTYDILLQKGYDAVQLTKIDEKSYKISLSPIDSYESFKKMFPKRDHS